MLVDQILEARTIRLSVAELLAASLTEDQLDEVAESLTEASVRSLWASAMKAFPHTKRRQNVLDRVRTQEVKWQPFPGLKIILASARVLGEQYPEKPRLLYRTNLMFRGVKFSESAKKGLLKITTRGASPGVPQGNVFFEKLTFNDSVRVRCNCPDFRWRWSWENESQTPSALFGPKAPPYTPPNPEHYRGPANPSGLPGLCKHIMTCGLSLHKSGAILLN